MGLWKRAAQTVAPSAATEAGEYGLPPEVQRALLDTPSRASLIQAVRDRLTDLTAAQKSQLVDRIAARTALWIVHLPASADYHHSAPCGLLDHAMDVAVRALNAALDMRFSDERCTDPGREYDLLPRWRYAAFLFGLLHDIGKATEVTVETAASVRWHPFAEPLAAFLVRHQLWPVQSASVAVDWTRDRGLETHERHNTYLAAQIITPQAATYLGPVLSLALAQEGAPGKALAAIISSADQDSVTADRKSRLVDAAARTSSRPGFLTVESTVADYFPAALQRAMENGLLSLNVPGGDAFVGDHYIALTYPAALLKVMELVRDRWQEQDARAKHLRLDHASVRAFVRDLSLRRFVFRDKDTGTWKLKADIRCGDEALQTFCILVRKETIEADAFRLFAGRIRFCSIIDDAPIGIDDFSVARMPNAAPVESPPPAAPPAAEEEDMPSPAVTFIDPEEMLATLRKLISTSKLPTNVTGGACFVTPETTYLVWPRGLVPIREAMNLPFDPFADKPPYFTAFSQMPFVHKDERGRIVASIKFRPDAESICRVVRIDTDGLFQDKEALKRLGYWPDAHLIQLAPPDARITRRPPQ